MRTFRTIDSQKKKRGKVEVISSFHFWLEGQSLPVLCLESGRPATDQWRDRWRAPGCVKDSCDAKMVLPLPCEIPVFTLVFSLKENWTDVLTGRFDSSSYHFFIAVQSSQEVESHPWAAEHNIPLACCVFLPGLPWQLFLSLSFCHFLCSAGQIASSAQSGGRC